MTIAGGGTPPGDPAARAGRTADLALRMTSEPARVMVDEILTYTLVVENRGPDTARGARLIDSLPDALIDPMYSCDGGETFHPWPGFLQLGALAPGSVVTILLAAQVETWGNGYILNTAQIVGQDFDPDPSNDTCCCMVTTKTAEPVA